MLRQNVGEILAELQARFGADQSGIMRAAACSLPNSQNFLNKQGSVVRRPDSTIHWIAIFLTFVKLAVDRYNFRLRFGIYKLKFLRSIVGSRSVVSQLFG